MLHLQEKNRLNISKALSLSRELQDSLLDSTLYGGHAAKGDSRAALGDLPLGSSLAAPVDFQQKLIDIKNDISDYTYGKYGQGAAHGARGPVLPPGKR